jgi:hypothetical protein
MASGCKEVMTLKGGTVRCIAEATHGEYCSIHRRCVCCNTHHPDKTAYVCTKCGREMCVVQTDLSASKDKDKAEFRRTHRTGAASCGPVIAKASAAA